VTHITDLRAAVSIGEASRRTGIPVRTIRFYCDEELLRVHRTSGGHRVFTGEALTRLTSIRRLRAVGLGLPVIAAILADEDATRGAVATERRAVEAELDALSWRHAVLLALEGTREEDRAVTLARLAGVAERGAARDVLVGFWRRVLAAMPAGLFDEFVAMDIPAVPATPTPGHVLAVAELAELARSPDLGREVSRELWLCDRENSVCSPAPTPVPARNSTCSSPRTPRPGADGTPRPSAAGWRPVRPAIPRSPGTGH
jgi:DNA-binding transcriptional MerR regulator